MAYRNRSHLSLSYFQNSSMECTGRRQDNDVPGRRKRVITEARKEQNRAAQQAYRKSTLSERKVE